MTDEKEMTLTDEMKQMLPEIDFDGLEAASEPYEKLMIRLDIMETNQKLLTDALETSMKLYSEMMKETKVFKTAEIAYASAYQKGVVDFSTTLSNLLTIDYKALAPNLEIDTEKVAKAMEKSIMETVVTLEFATKVAKSLAETVDGEAIAAHIDADNVAEYILQGFDPTDYWCTSDIAEHFSHEDIAYQMDVENIAYHLDLGSIAGYIEVGDLGENLDFGELATHLDLKTLAKHVDVKKITTLIIEAMDTALGAITDIPETEEEI